MATYDRMYDTTAQPGTGGTAHRRTSSPAGQLPANGAGLPTPLSPDDFARYLPGYGGPRQPQDLSALFAAAQAPLIPPELANAPRGGGRQPRGGGAPGANPLASARGLLNSQFSGGAPTIDPRMQGTIDSLINQGRGGFDQFTGLVGGGQDPILQMIMAELGGGPGGGPVGVGAGGAGMAFGGGGGAGIGLSNPDISLKAISPEAQALIDQMTKGRTSALGLQRSDDQGKLMADLFGRGINRSTVAGDAAGRMMYGHDVALEQALSSGAQQTLQAMLADQQARTELGKSRLGAEAQLGSASAGASASAAAAGAAAQADMARARLGLLGDVFNSRGGALASAFGSQQSSLGNFAGILGDIGLGQLSADTERGRTALGLVDSNNQLRGTLGAARIGANSATNVARINQQTQLAGLPFDQMLRAYGMQNDIYGREQQGILGLLGLGNDRYGIDRNAEAQIEAARLGRPREPSTLDRILGLGGAVLGNAGLFATSDARLKDEVRDSKSGGLTDEELEALMPKQWRWKGSAKALGLEGEDRGVIAQDVEKVRPQFVKKFGGVRAVNAGALIEEALATAHRLLGEKKELAHAG